MLDGVLVVGDTLGVLVAGGAVGPLDDGADDGAADGALDVGEEDGVLVVGPMLGTLDDGTNDGAADGALDDGAKDGRVDATGSAVGAWVGLQLRSTPDGRSLGYTSGCSVQQVRAHNLV